jgi:hypothetical protein
MAEHSARAPTARFPAAMHRRDFSPVQRLKTSTALVRNGTSLV